MPNARWGSRRFSANPQAKHADVTIVDDETIRMIARQGFPELLHA